MKEVKEITYEKRIKADFDKFLKALNGDDKNRVGLLYKNYNGGVIFGDNKHLFFIKDTEILSAKMHNLECVGLATIFDNSYKALSDYTEVETITRGTSDFIKKALKLEGENVSALVNESLVGDIPKGAKFYIVKPKLPVLVVYNNEIIKVIMPFVNGNFREPA